jgi:dynein heavy chain
MNIKPNLCFKLKINRIHELHEWKCLFSLGEIPSALPTLYEYFYDNSLKQWVPWSKKVPKYVHNPERKFNEILVPTVDTVRATWLLELMVGIKHPVVLVGETGTSKTATTANFLRTLSTETHVSLLTARTYTCLYQINGSQKVKFRYEFKC